MHNAKRKPLYTPEEFAKRMKAVLDSGDIEAAHSAADHLMCDLLYSLGYVEGVKLFAKADKWYA